jgi:AcrR family transcriptional regulator
MSLEAVAAAAGTTVPTLRRRYADRAQLAAAVIDALRITPLPAATGDPRADALAVLENFDHNLRRPPTMATLGSILSEEHRRPELLARFRANLVRPRRAILAQALTAGVDAGLLPSGLDVEVACNMLIGSFYARRISHGRLPRDWSQRALETIWPSGSRP